MAVHRISLPNKPFSKQKVGNSISTKCEWTGKYFVVFWKYNEEKKFLAKAGDKIQLKCGGGFPKVVVMKAPIDPVTRIAWERSFFRGKRCTSLEELKEKCKGETFYSRSRGYDLPACAIYTSKKENCAVAYKSAMGGFKGKPFLWWTNSSCSPKELDELIAGALNVSALHTYT